MAMSSSRSVPISVAIPSFEGEGRLLATLERIIRCDPTPAEILIHCDGGWRPDVARFEKLSVPVTLLYSEIKKGPGGGRDACIRAATHDLVASFDDDSWPLDVEYFAQAQAIMDAMPQAAILSPAVYLAEKPIRPQCPELNTACYYQGSASIHRRGHYLELMGFVPIPAAYGVEETDLSLQTHSAGYKILESPWLRAWHDRSLADKDHQILPWIRNEILLAFLRYPLIAQPWGWWRAWRHVWRNREEIPLKSLLKALVEAIPLCQQYRRFIHRYRLAQILNHLRMRSERYQILRTPDGIKIQPLAAISIRI